ncbi:hypothetical protein GCM10010201_28730 [Pilimelia columellifera subsp. columellifera]|uniref:Cation-transporting P-type ATPase C-terminal domain-containing protein n=1 Tax=Pilimelia columellifera subsp. columellifera TaxID=706583 RepID=A0ABP6AZ91_9ACTN
MLGDGLVRGIVSAASLITVTALVAALVAQRLDRPWQSALFVVLGLAQLGVALAVRATRAPGSTDRNPWLVAVAVSAALQVAGVLVAPLRELLGTEPLSSTDLLWCAALATAPGFALYMTRIRVNRAHPGS